MDNFAVEHGLKGAQLQKIVYLMIGKNVKKVNNGYNRKVFKTDFI